MVQSNASKNCHDLSEKEKNIEGFRISANMAKLWSVSLEQFIRHKPLISEMCN